MWRAAAAKQEKPRNNVRSAILRRAALGWSTPGRRLNLPGIGREVAIGLTIHDSVTRTHRLVGMPLGRNKTGVHSGAPVLRGTRMPVNAIVENFEYGVSV